MNSVPGKKNQEKQSVYSNGTDEDTEPGENVKGKKKGCIISGVWDRKKFEIETVVSTAIIHPGKSEV